MYLALDSNPSTVKKESREERGKESSLSGVSPNGTVHTYCAQLPGFNLQHPMNKQNWKKGLGIYLSSRGLPSMLVALDLRKYKEGERRKMEGKEIERNGEKGINKQTGRPLVPKRAW